ncbi:MAG TPA: hypothetical protein VMZ30_22455 [Pyrinomonadaceae bacterium]|nr:hypothetical protein [Pyrinomonadaceae bacterium]
MTGEEFHPDVAEEILLATRAFMRRLAEGLPASQELGDEQLPQTPNVSGDS